MMQSRLKDLNEQIDSCSQSIETIERTKIEEMNIIQMKDDTLDNELDKTRARVEVAEQRAGERRREETRSAIRATARTVPSDNRVERE
jgi:restriction endonuclease S subunit